MTESDGEFDEPARESIDHRLAAALWAWSRDPAFATDRQHIASLDVASLLEWFLCDAFRHSPDGAQREWWSDGVVTLSLTQLSTWDSCAPALIEKRPRHVADWAMAIELTPL